MSFIKSVMFSFQVIKWYQQNHPTHPKLSGGTGYAFFFKLVLRIIAHSFHVSISHWARGVQQYRPQDPQTPDSSPL